MQSGSDMYAGYFGKYPGYRDFVQHGMDSSLVEQFRSWLSAVMDVGQERYEELWRDIYFQGPVWRFLLRDSSLGAATWAGAIMPSMDARERYFPLIAVRRIDQPVSASLFNQMAAFLDQLETVMLATLQTPYADVADVRCHFDEFFSQDFEVEPVGKVPVVSNQSWLNSEIDQFIATQKFDMGIWQAVNVANDKPCLRVVGGFPGESEFVDMWFETVALDEQQDDDFCVSERGSENEAAEASKS